MKGSEIRNAFLTYFSEKGHNVVSSSSLVPQGDNTLLFANAGMNQFKDIFLGKETRSYKRATTCQKVVRAGGKHNDLENVGRTARHHTFFEMLGNFSFGDYFKEDAIQFAWEFLTVNLKLPVDKLFVTIYQDDEEAFDIWHKVIGLDSSRIIRKGEKDNFWQMGDTGPCGPCSEIFVDQGPEVGCKRKDCDVHCDCDRHLEIWNLVFMQYNRDENGTLNPLPKPSIDTGMGLERVAGIVQGKQSNYETDLIKPIINYISILSGKTYGGNIDNDVSMRVIADHSRSATFLIADGVLPSNEARGYVLRRIMRRAMRHAKMLGLESGEFSKVCSYVVDFMKSHYVELADKKAYIVRTVATEESAFARTLSNGMKLIAEDLIPNAKNKIISGQEIFKIYDTHGFPIDLLEDIIGDAGLKLDIIGFEKCMQEQQERAKRGGLSSGGVSVSDALKRIGAEIETEFAGYMSLVTSGKVVAIVKDGESVDIINEGEKAEIILDITTFYAEGGGQVGDSGIITVEGSEFKVNTTYKVGGAYIHQGTLTKGSIAKGQNVLGTVDEARRRLISQNHTATHLLHKALQKFVGEHARQAGSMVTEHGLRFDFTNSTGLSHDVIKNIEMEVNSKIFENIPMLKRIESINDAIKSGATALFGEKYDEIVRVIEVQKYSIELCGGMHVDRTCEIGLFKITSEQSVAAGVRRIEAVTGLNAFKYLNDIELMAKNTSNLLKCSTQNLSMRVEELLVSIKDKDKQVKSLVDKLVANRANSLMDNVKVINGVKVLSIKIDDDNISSFVDSARDSIKSGIILAANIVDGKGAFLCAVTKDLVGVYNAGEIIKEVTKVANGTGGGKSDLARGGTKDIDKINDALNKIFELI